MPSRLPALAGALLVALAVPASAQAVPTIEPLKPCYVTAGTAGNPQGERVGVRAAGFSPNAKVDIALDGEMLPRGTGLQADPEGVLQVPEFPAPFVREGSRDFAITLTEQGNPANTVTATARSTALGVIVKPREARPAQRIRFRGNGFTAAKPVYAHYVFNGRQRARARIVRRTGECGRWSVRRPQFPMRNPSQGTWFVQFDQSRKYVDPSSNKLDSVFVRLKITIRLVPR